MRRMLILAAAAGLTLSLAACDDDDKVTGPAVPTYSAAMKGSNEVPANTSTATGNVSATISNNVLSYTVTWSGLTSTATAGHFHIGAPGANGGALIGIPGITGTAGSASGTVSLSLANVATVGTQVVSGDSLVKALNLGNVYANIHNTSFTGGEVRGNLVKQ